MNVGTRALTNNFGYVEWMVLMDASTTQADIYGFTTWGIQTSTSTAMTDFRNSTTTDLSNSFTVTLRTSPDGGNAHINFVGMIIERLRLE